MATVIGYTGNRVRIAAIGDKKVDLTMDHLEVAKMLIDNDADVLAVDKESKTALVCAHERFKSGKTWNKCLYPTSGCFNSRFVSMLPPKTIEHGAENS